MAKADTRAEALPAQTFSLAISAGEFLSAPVNVIGQMTYICMPMEWTPAVLTFQVSPDSGVTWFDLYRQNGVEVSVNVIPGGASRVVAGDDLDNKTYIRFRSGSKDYPVPQDDDRAFTIVAI